MKRLLVSSRRQEGYKKKKYEKSTIIIIVVIALLAIWGVTGYNGLVTMDENVSGQWSNVETQYQRRADLIPNLVNTVKGYASHEKETLEGVVEARSKATQMTIDANDLTPENWLNTKSTGRGYFRPWQTACHYRELSRLESQSEFSGIASPTGRDREPHQRSTHQFQQCCKEL